MKRIILAGASALMLAACGGDYQAIVDACVEGGGNKAECTCTADIAKENLSAEQLSIFAGLLREDENVSSDVLENMSLADMTAFGVVGVEAARACK